MLSMALVLVLLVLLVLLQLVTLLAMVGTDAMRSCNNVGRVGGNSSYDNT